MSEIRFIVEKLCSEPFNKSLTLVTFDELNPFELLGLLNEVFTALDSRHKLDLRDEAQDQTAARFMEFLHILKYNVPQPVDRFQQALMDGKQSVIYPILHWVLSRMDSLKKRAYLGRYLVPFPIPKGYLHDPTVSEIYQQHQRLQEEFTETHKMVDRLRKSSNISPSDLRREITQLEEERHQLNEKIEALKRKTEFMDGFQALFQVTSALRGEQEEEGKIQDRRREQLAALRNSEARLAAVSNKLSQMKDVHDGNVPPIQLLKQLEQEVEDNRTLLKRKLVTEIHQQKTKLQELHQRSREPSISLSDVQDKRAETENMEREIQKLGDQLARAQRDNGEDKLKGYRQQSSMVKKKLREKQLELEDLRDQGKVIEQKYLEKEKAAAELAGPNFMRHDEFKQYANTLRTKTAHYKKLKKDMGTIRAESVVLSRTEAILKSRCPDITEFLKQYEAKKQASIEDESSSFNNGITENDQVEDTEVLSVEEISLRLTKLKEALKEKKMHLAPKIKELREIRQQYQVLETDYLQKKAIYENTAVGLESEKIKLEQDCDSVQEECLREESRIHYLNNLMSIAEVQLQRVQQELEYQQGNGQLRRDFKCHQDLYNAKVQQQEQLSKELRKKQKQLKEVEGVHAEQRQMFVDLKKILAIKLQVAQTHDQTHMGSGEGVLDLGQDIGGANVMTIEQG